MKAARLFPEIKTVPCTVCHVEFKLDSDEIFSFLNESTRKYEFLCIAHVNEIERN